MKIDQFILSAHHKSGNVTLHVMHRLSQLIRLALTLSCPSLPSDLKLFTMGTKGSGIGQSFLATARQYCEVCTPHGFSYWVSSKRTGEKLFWVSVVLVCFTGSSYFIKTAIQDWNDNPIQTTVNALGIPITKLDHPAITICKPNGIYDIGEYVRAVFNNFKFSCKSEKDSESCQAANLLRSHYRPYSDLNQTGGLPATIWKLLKDHVHGMFSVEQKNGVRGCYRAGSYWHTVFLHSTVYEHLR